MPEYFFQEFLSRFPGGAVTPCPCGKGHRIGVRDILAGSGALEASAELFRRRHGPETVVWVLSDGNTEAAAGERWKTALGAARIVSHVLPGEPKPVPTLELVEELANEAREDSPQLLAAVGSGVVSDLVKKVSAEIGIPNWCIATAPSVDAYTSATSAIRVRGYGKPLPASVSEVVVCDLDVITRAPRTLFLSGLGDLLAKYLAFLDWNLSRLLTGEHYCAEVEGFALGSARKAIEAARQVAADPISAARSLTDAVLVSGLAMQAMGASRPAAAAEHTIAHFWEMSSAVGREELDLHGILVGAASRLVLRGCQSFYRTLDGADPDPALRLAALEKEPPWELAMDPRMMPFIEKMREEAKRFDRAETAAHLAAFRREKRGVLELARPLLEELDKAVEVLEGLGYPFAPGVLGIHAPFDMLPVRHLRYLRNRYSTFSLAHELGLEEELAAVIGKSV
jgi:glycerol-1-phosphate dehydrogenase [NAD(P)+]